MSKKTFVFIVLYSTKTKFAVDIFEKEKDYICISEEKRCL